MAILKYEPAFGGHDAIVARNLNDSEKVIAVSHGGYGDLGTMRPTDAKLYVTSGRILIVPSASTRQPRPDPKFGTECIKISFDRVVSEPKPKGLIGVKRLEFPEFGLELFGPKSFISAAASAIAATK